MKTRRIIRQLASLFAVGVLVAACAGEDGDGQAAVDAPDGESQQEGDSDEEAQPAAADDFPSQPIEFVTMSSPGGGADTMLRVLVSGAEGLTQPAIVVNRAGAGGANLEAYVQDRPADGHTVWATTTSSLLFYFTNDLEMNPAEDWQPVLRMMVDPGVLAVRGDGPWETMDDLADAMQAGEVNFCGPSVGGKPHISFVLLARKVGADDQAYIAFDSSGDAYPAILGGQCDAIYTETTAVSEFVAAGDMKALAVEGDVDGFEDVPSFQEAGYDDTLITQWRGIHTHADTPPEAVEWLHDVLRDTIDNSESWANYVEEGGVLDGYLGPEDFQAQMEEQEQVIGDLLRELGIVD